MSLLGTLFSATMAAQTLRMAVPYAAAALAGVVGERSGVVNIGLEGMLLASGFASVAAHIATGSPWWGLVAGVAAGVALGAFHGLLAVLGRVDAIISGVALNLVAAGGTRFLLRAFYDSSSNSPFVSGFRAPAFIKGEGAAMLARALVDPLTILLVTCVLAAGWVLQNTRFGLRLSAAGEDPHAASSAGISVDGVRMAALALAGAVVGLGGVALAFDQHQFQAGMSGGRGFIALAAVILSGWRPGRAAAACLAFAALDALQIVLQDRPWLPAGVVQMLPFVATVVAIAVVAQRRARRGDVPGGPPAGLGRHAS